MFYFLTDNINNKQNNKQKNTQRILKYNKLWLKEESFQFSTKKFFSSEIFIN